MVHHCHISRPLIKKYGKQFQGARDIKVHQTDDQHIFHAYEMIKIKEQSTSMQFTVNTYISACSCDTEQNGLFEAAYFENTFPLSQ